MRYLILLLVSLLFSAVGFYMYIYFFSVGYGLSVAALGAAQLILYRGQLEAPQVLASLILVVYGVRLGGYLLLREWKSAAYRRVLDPELDRSRRMPLGPKVAIWLACGLLYFLQTSPLTFRLENGAPAGASLWIGVVLMACGVALEAAADAQKTRAKRAAPYRFVDTGLFRLARCPNYLGELLLWLGVLVAGWTALRGPFQWVCALCGFLLITYVMFSGARRLELRQDKNYGDDPEYREYCKTVPILIPFVPLYSVKKYGFLVA